MQKYDPTMGNLTWGRLSALVTVGVLVLLATTACSSNDQFALVDKAAADTHITNLGHLILKYQSGSYSSIDGPGPAYDFVFTQTPKLQQQAIDRLLSAGFKPSGTKRWERRSGNHYVDVTVTNVDGTYPLTHAGKAVTLPAQGATVVEFLTVPV